MKDYYALLGIDANATKSDIKRNYRLLATKFHPDKNSDAGAASKFIAITEAYDVLSNRKSRTQYDLKRWQTLKKRQEAEYSFTAVVPPSIRLRVRRNQAQQKRSINYRKAKHKSGRIIRLLSESFYMVGRYTFHILGISVLGVILSSAIMQLPDIIKSGYAKGILICVVALGLLYGIFKIAEHLYFEFKEDIKAFSDSYMLPVGKAAFVSLSVFALVLVLYGVILK